MPIGYCRSTAARCSGCSMKSSLWCGLLALASVCVSMQAATLTLVPVTAFGKPLDGCTVDRVMAVEGSKAWTEDFAPQFQGLVGTDIPLGRYDVTISCPGVLGWKSKGWKRVNVALANQAEMVARSETVMSVEARVPTLTISLKGRVPKGQIWWARLSGVYDGLDVRQRFDRKNGIAGFWIRDTGSYVVTIGSSAGYRCVRRRIDFAEWTRAWAFDPSTCTFDLDEFAHLVGEGEARAEEGEWYDKIRRKQEDLRRLLDMRSPNQAR